MCRWVFRRTTHFLYLWEEPLQHGAVGGEQRRQQWPLESASLLQPPADASARRHRPAARAAVRVDVARRDLQLFGRWRCSARGDVR